MYTVMLASNRKNRKINSRKNEKEKKMDVQLAEVENIEG